MGWEMSEEFWGTEAIPHNCTNSESPKLEITFWGNVWCKWFCYGGCFGAKRRWKALCDFVVQISHKLGAVVFRRPYLPHFSSKSYTVWSVGFTSWALKWYIACRKWTSGSAPKVRKTTAAAILYFLHSVFLLSLLLSLHTLNDFGKGLSGSKAWFLHEF